MKFIKSVDLEESFIPQYFTELVGVHEEGKSFMYFALKGNSNYYFAVLLTNQFGTRIDNIAEVFVNNEKQTADYIDKTTSFTPNAKRQLMWLIRPYIL